MVVALKPISANRKPSPRFTSRLQSAAATHGAQLLSGALYARISWFQLRRSQGDVDNIAKRILDSLIGVVIRDDDDIVRCLTQKAVADSTGAFSLNVLSIRSSNVL